MFERCKKYEKELENETEKWLPVKQLKRKNRKENRRKSFWSYNPGVVKCAITLPDYKNSLYLVPYFYTIKYDISLFK